MCHDTTSKQHLVMVVLVPLQADTHKWNSNQKDSIYIFKKKKKKRQMTSGDICVSTCENPQTLSGTFHASITQQVWEPEEKPRLCPWPRSQLIHSSQWKSRQDVSSGPDPIRQLQRHQQTPSSPHPIFPLRTDHSKLLRHLECLKISNTDECLGGGGGGGRTPERS